MEGASNAGIEEIQQGLSIYRSMGESHFMSYHLALLAEACGQAGNAVRGLEALAEALDVIVKGQDDGNAIGARVNY